MAYKKKYVPKKKETKFTRYARKGRKALKTTAQIAADVARLSVAVGYMSSRLNVEKKFKDRDVVSGQFAQANASGNGIYMMDVTPAISQGIDSDERIGNSLKLTGMSFPIQFSGALRTVSARKLRVMLFKVTAADNGVNLTEAINDYFDVNPINGIIDMNSPKAYRKHTHDGIKLIRSKVYTLPAAASTDYKDDNIVEAEEKSSFMAKFNVKMDEVVRYNSSTDIHPDGCRYYMYFFADKGNCGTTSATVPNVPITETETGVRFTLAQRYWWVDN